MNRFTFLLLMVFSVLWLPHANGQDQRRTQRRALVEELLKGLIESNIDRPPAEEPRNNVAPHDPRHPNRNPNLNPNVRPVEVSRDMMVARNHLRAWNAASGSLIEELRHHEFESPQLRPLLADAIRIRANIELLSRKAELYPTVDPLIQDFQLIDRDWRVLSHRLKQTRGLPAECSGFVTTITDLDSQLCGIFKMQPQIDRRELLRLATKLRSDYDHLLQDVYYLVRGQRGGGELINEGKQLQSLIAQASALVGRADYESIVNAYQQCTSNWKSFSRKLQRLQDDRLRHSIADIEVTGRLIHEQLWLPVELDREYLASMANAITQDTQRVFDSITLTQLLSVKQPGTALTLAREFQHASLNFSNGISSGASIDDLEWDFRLFEVQWNQIHDIFHEFKVASIDHQLEGIEFSMATLKQSFGDGPAMDPIMMAQLTANLDALFRQTSVDVHHRISERRYDKAFHEQICATADRLSQTAGQLHQRVLREPNRVISRSDLNDLFIQWRTLKPMFNQCQEQDKLALNQYRSQIEPLMVKLQVVFAE